MPAERFDFRNAEGQKLAALLDRPDGETGRGRAVRALLHLRQGQPGGQAHRRRADRRGIAVLRFDFTGLGASEGEFANTTFLLERRRSGRRRRSSAPDARARPRS